MAQTGYTPIQLYYSSTTTNAPTAGNLASGELAINITDGKLFYKDNGGVVQVIAWKTTPTTAGGTGLTSWTAGDLPYYATGTTLSKLGIGTNGQILTSTGTAPQWSTLSGVAVTTFSAGTTGFTPSSATSGAVTLAGTLATTNGGTGLTSFTANRVFYASSTSAIGQSANLTFDGTTLTANALTTTSTVTINGGTANGVAYLNGSKVLTTGSALTFDGTTFVSANTQTGLHSMRVYNGSNASAGDGAGIQFGVNASNIYGRLWTDNNSAAMYFDNLLATPFIWRTSGTSEQMRLTSTGLGIGTSSPGEKLHVIGASITGDNTNGYVKSYVDSVKGYLQSLNAARNAYRPLNLMGSTVGFENASGNTLLFDSSGNLGLGVTPNTWNTGGSPKVAQIGSSVVGTTGGQDTAFFGANFYINSGDKYVGTGFATQYRQQSGQHQWSTAGSGTAGNAISFTQAMTLDCGTAVDRTNLLVGTTSGFSSAAGRGNISVNGSSDAIVALGFGGTRKGYLYAAGSQVNVGSDGFMVFETSGTERARITSAGNLVIGQTTATSRLTVNSNMDITDGTINVRVSQSGGSALIGTTTNHPFFFMTNDTERARITSVGNLSLGGTADRGTTVGSAALQLFNGTAPAGTLTNGVSLYSQSGDLRFMDAAGNAYQVGFRNVPQSGAAKTGSYTLATGDVGEFIQISTGGSIVIPNSTFAAGDVVSLFNNTSGSITITCSTTNAYIAGTDTNKASMTLATRGVATILFVTSTLCVVSGNVT